ncbi:MAG: PilZ domain-containing protein [Planctomycetota bacterium]
MKAAGDFLVYSCPDCGKRIFTERAFLGRTGTCPLCGGKHPVGGLREAEEAGERRGAARVQPPQRTRVEVAPGVAGGPAALGRESLHPLLDLSTTGVGFVLHGAPDSRQLAGFRPPALKVGDVIDLTLHSAKIELRPRTFQVEVRRIVPSTPKGTFTVGAQFVGLTPELSDHLERLLDGAEG